MTLLAVQDEREKVEDHRRNFFREILGKGIPADDIEQLVHSEVSPHEAQRLKEIGCSSELIVKILL